MKESEIINLELYDSVGGSGEQKNLLLVDDHEMILIGMKTFLEKKTGWIVSGVAKSIASAKELLQSKSPSELPQIIIIDIELGEENGFDLALYVRESFPSVKIIMYTMHDENDYILKAKQIKIDGYISKASDSEEFVKCIDTISAGNKYLENRLLEGQSVIDEALSLLTKREATIFKEMITGKTNEEIATALSLSKHSVEVYATTIYEKTFCQNRTEFLKKFR